MLLTIGFLIAFCALAIFLAGLLALTRNNEKPENRWFFVLGLVLGPWVVVNYLDSNIRLAEETGHFLVRLDFVLALFIGWSLLQFVTHLIYNSSKYKQQLQKIVSRKFSVVSLSLNAILSLSLTTDLVLSTGTKDGLPTVDPGVFFPLYVLALAGYFAPAVGILLFHYFQGSRSHRRSLSLMILGFIVAMVANIMTNLVFPNVIDDRNTVQALNLFGYAGVFFLVFCIYLAITTRKLFDIKLVIVRSLVYLLLLGLVGVFYAAAIVLLGFIATGESRFDTGLVLTSLVVTLFIAGTFQYIRRFIDRVTSKLFFRDAYEPQEVLDQLTRLTSSSTDLDYILRRSKKILEGTLKSSYCAFILTDKTGQTTHVSNDAVYGADKMKRLAALIPRTHGPVIAELLEETDERHVLLRELSAELVFPFYTTEGVFGILVLGTKQNGVDYVQDDIKLLTIATSSLSVAIQNALRFEEIERFNETLQQKVDDATRRLRISNQKLKELNDSKDDFIGMASHQLRTPLTSIKGYVSLVMEGDAGKVNATQRKLLAQAFSSSQKMVYLIADLLNVSRLKTGKFSIERRPTQLVKLVREEIEQLDEEFKLRDLKFEFKAPDKFPVLPLDDTKTRQVVMNFLDNAVYYTKPGGHIKAELIELPHSVEFRVTDNGIGVAKSEHHQLFTKFYRAKNAQRTRPDGTGLGLYMAKKVVMAQGGAIIFDSEEGKGSTFGFTFPKDLPENGVDLPALDHD